MDYTILTDEELRQAAVALSIIQDKGDPDEFQYILAHHREHAERGPLGIPGSVGFELNSGPFADELASILGADRERCRRAVQDAFGGDQRARQSRDAFHALLSYAAELTRKRAEPEPDDDPVGTFTNNLLETYNRYGLDGIIDYHCGRLGPPYDEPEPGRESSRPAKERANIL
jgi:hypothetical protein